MKKIQLVLASLLSVFLLTSCQSGPYKKTNDGVIVTLKTENANSTKHVRLQIINDDIIRVSATPANNFPENKSLITIYDKTKTEGWDVSEQNGNVILKTATTIASVSLATGEVSFSGINGLSLIHI